MKIVKVSAKYGKLNENGSNKPVTEHYLVDALSITEAESRVVEYLKPYVGGELTTTAAQLSKVDDVFNTKDADKLYLAKVGFITIDEKTAKEKRTTSQWLVGGTDFNDAYEQVLRVFNSFSTNVPELISLSESKFTAFVPYNNNL